MPKKQKSNRGTFGSSGSATKRKRVPPKADEDRPSSSKKRKEDDYCCEPPDIEYYPECICIEPQDCCCDEQDIDTCIPLCCRPCPYWEREIVKFNPVAKWDPQIEEKEESGHPNLKKDAEGNKKGSSSSKSKNNKKGSKKDDKDKFIAIGEPCNAYRCYKDACVPKGMAYCTRKHPKRNTLPPCPQKFPIKPIRFKMCPMADDMCANQSCGWGSINDPYNYNQGSIYPQNSDLYNNNSYLQDCAPDTCSQFYQQIVNQPYDRNYDQQVRLFQIQNVPCPPENDDCCCCCDDDKNKNSKIPDEWLMELPLCDDQKPPNLKRKINKIKKKEQPKSRQR